MTKNLLIIESPAKAKTINKYLGPDFRIMASVGHLKDLPVNKLGVDIEDNFLPEYVTVKGKDKILRELKKAGKESDTIYLAPDPDREGEAIAWHIAQELKKGKGVKKIYRVLFNELTAKAIKEAVASPMELNLDKFESQQARRVLDRLVGYQISPLLWPRVKRGLSAGRVQSVAVKMICAREREIFAFDSEEYWSLTARLEGDTPPAFNAKFVRYKNKKYELKNEKITSQIISEIANETFRIKKITRKQKKRNPPTPFITSLLQQEANKKHGFSAKKTMAIAQNLYEGLLLGDKGQIGLITYMRTDSFRLSNDALIEAQDYILKAYGPDFLPAKPNTFKNRKGAQEAHEAIRPTSARLTPEDIKAYLNNDQLKLYTLIWKRFLASQMKPAIMDQTQVEIEAGKAMFRASGSIVVFTGFTALYEQFDSNRSKKEDNTRLPSLEKDQILKLHQLEPAQHFTQPPPRFTEASLIKALEGNGIGRPSTYAAIIANISGREYVAIEKKRFRPTELGFLVTDLLVQNFPDIIDTPFTAHMENQLDKIERGEIKWTQVLKDFYEPFEKELNKAQDEMNGEILTDISCPECKRKMAIKSGRNGLFLACTGYPECKYTANFTRDAKGRIEMEIIPDAGEEKGVCELCGKPMLIKNGRYGSFLACSGYPECKNTKDIKDGLAEDSNIEVCDIKCKKCGSRMIIKRSRTGQKFYACEKFPVCKHTESISTNVPCPEKDCQGMLVERLSKKGRKFYACNKYPDCRFAIWDDPYDDVCPDCNTAVLRIKRPKNSDPMLVSRKKGCGYKRPYSLPDKKSSHPPATG